MLDLESFRKEIDQIYIEKIGKMVGEVHPEILKKHNERMENRLRLANRKHTKTTKA